MPVTYVFQISTGMEFTAKYNTDPAAFKPAFVDLPELQSFVDLFLGKMITYSCIPPAPLSDKPAQRCPEFDVEVLKLVGALMVDDKLVKVRIDPSRPVGDEWCKLTGGLAIHPTFDGTDTLIHKRGDDSYAFAAVVAIQIQPPADVFLTLRKP